MRLEYSSSGFNFRYEKVSSAIRRIYILDNGGNPINNLTNYECNYRTKNQTVIKSLRPNIHFNCFQLTEATN
ncbi:751_t:CDS:1, partial [Cetraspora pellucida]